LGFTSTVQDGSIHRALRHARARWLGVVLMGLGLALLLLGAWLAWVGYNPISQLLLPFATIGLGLATFGTHNDTALSLLAERRLGDPLPERLSVELDQEFIFHRLDLSDLRPTPRTAWVMTGLAVGVLLWAILATLSGG
jgi:hypothetical protein